MDAHNLSLFLGSRVSVFAFNVSKVLFVVLFQTHTYIRSFGLNRTSMLYII